MAAQGMTVLLVVGTLFTIVGALVATLIVRSIRRGERARHALEAYVAGAWDATVDEVAPLQDGTPTSRTEPHPRSVLRVRFTRTDGSPGRFHVVRNERTGRDDPAHAFRLDFAESTVPPDPPPPYEEVRRWEPGTRLHKPAGRFYPAPPTG